MCTEQYLDIVQTAHIVVVDGNQSHLVKSLTLHAVVYDVAKTIEGVSFCQFLLCFLDGSSHSEAKATAVVYLDLQHIRRRIYLPNCLK